MRQGTDTHGGIVKGGWESPLHVQSTQEWELFSEVPILAFKLSTLCRQLAHRLWPVGLSFAQDFFFPLLTGSAGTGCAGGWGFFHLSSSAALTAAVSGMARIMPMLLAMPLTTSTAM